MLGPGFNSVLPCILTTSSTSREIISIALGDYSDHSLKSLNCNSTQKSHLWQQETIPFHGTKFTCCLSCDSAPTLRIVVNSFLHLLKRTRVSKPFIQNGSGISGSKYMTWDLEG